MQRVGYSEILRSNNCILDSNVGVNSFNTSIQSNGGVDSRRIDNGSYAIELIEEPQILYTDTYLVPPNLPGLHGIKPDVSNH